jgi:hypothetical protein
MAVPDSREVVVPLPPHAKAPGFRDGFSTLAGMRVREVTDDWLAIAPREGPGVVYEYFRLARLCHSSAQPSDAAWARLLANPPLHADERLLPNLAGDGRDWRERLRAWADRINDPERPEAYLASIGATLTTLPLDEAPAFLSARAREFFAVYPEASFWFLETDELLIKRFAMLRALLAVALAPDVIDENDPEARTLPQLRTLQEHSLTRGSDFGRLIDPLLLTFSPGALGYVFNWMPHAIVFLTGINGSMVRDYPQTPSALYLPHIQAFGSYAWKDAAWFENIRGANAEALLQWWVARLNVVYSYLLDPTNFADLGRHSAPRQVATLLTFERLLADLLLVQAGFQGSELARQQAAFDLLDKAEALLGFGISGSGQGFERLLRRSSMLARLDEIWQRLPLQLQSRFRKHSRALYDGMYEHVREHAYAHRLAGGAIKVGPPGGPLVALSLEGYVPQLVRAVRNSAHGFIEVMTSNVTAVRRDRELLATHDGKLPPHVPDLAALIGFALVADFERVAERTWLPKP